MTLRALFLTTIIFLFAGDAFTLATPSDEQCTEKLDRFIQIDTTGEKMTANLQTQDTEFPAKMSSIAAPHEECGDKAAGGTAECSKFNTWSTFQTVAAKKPKKLQGVWV
jgi:hypothetical protein